LGTGRKCIFDAFPAREARRGGPSQPCGQGARGHPVPVLVPVPAAEYRYWRPRKVVASRDQGRRSLNSPTPCNARARNISHVRRGNARPATTPCLHGVVGTRKRALPAPARGGGGPIETCWGESRVTNRHAAAKRASTTPCIHGVVETRHAGAHPRTNGRAKCFARARAARPAAAAATTSRWGPGPGPGLGAGKHPRGWLGGAGEVARCCPREPAASACGEARTQRGNALRN